MILNRFFVCVRARRSVSFSVYVRACVLVRVYTCSCVCAFVCVCVCDSFVRGKESADTQVHNEDTLNLKI